MSIPVLVALRQTDQGAAQKCRCHEIRGFSFSLGESFFGRFHPWFRLLFPLGPKPPRVVSSVPRESRDSCFFVHRPLMSSSSGPFFVLVANSTRPHL